MSSVPIELETASFSLLEEDILADSEDFAELDDFTDPEDFADSEDSTAPEDSAGLSTGTSAETGPVSSLLLDSSAELCKNELEVTIGESATSSTDPVTLASSPPHAARRATDKAIADTRIFFKYIRNPTKTQIQSIFWTQKKSINEKSIKRRYYALKKRHSSHRVLLYIFYNNYTNCKTQIVKKRPKKRLFSAHFPPFSPCFQLWHAFCIMCGVTR